MSCIIIRNEKSSNKPAIHPWTNFWFVSNPSLRTESRQNKMKKLQSLSSSPFLFVFLFLFFLPCSSFSSSSPSPSPSLSLSHPPFMLVTQTRSASYLMVEMLNRTELGLYCDGEIFNPAVVDSYGHKLGKGNELSWKYMMESLRDFYGQHKDVIAGFKMMHKSLKSPTNRLIIDVMNFFPSMRAVFLLRNPFDSAISFLEASLSHKWIVYNSTVNTTFRAELKPKAVLSTDNKEGYFESGLVTSWKSIQKTYQKKFNSQKLFRSQYEWLKQNRPNFVHFVRSEDIMNTSTRTETMRGVYAFLLNISAQDEGYNHTMTKALESILETRNQQGRSLRTLTQRFLNWEEICYGAKGYMDNQIQQQDWEASLKTAMKKRCPNTTNSRLRPRVSPQRRKTLRPPLIHRLRPPPHWISMTLLIFTNSKWNAFSMNNSRILSVLVIWRKIFL